VRLVDDEQAAHPRGHLAQGIVVAGHGMDDADVGHHRLGQDAGDVTLR
jgi:hypothetical protein